MAHDPVARPPAPTNKAWRLVWWFWSCIFGLVPIAFNFFAAIVNIEETQTVDLRRVLAGDGYLYAFILSFAAVADFLGHDTPTPMRNTVGAAFIVFAFVAGGGDFLTSVNRLANNPMFKDYLAPASVIVVVLVFSLYLVCKIVTLRGSASEELK
jgi:hypothetical protein